jgi:autotransporter-associated beta strand protein
VQAISGGGLHTSGHSAVLNGPFTGSSEFWVDGGGSLTFNTDSPYTGDLYIREGALRVNATLPGTIRASLETTNPLFVFASVGGTGRVGDLSLRGTLVPGSSTTPHGTFSMSSLSLSGNNTVEFDLGPGGDLLSAENAFAKAIVANAPPDNLNYHSVFTSCTFSFNQLPGVQVGDTYDLVHFGTNGAYIAGTSTIRTFTVFSPSDFGYSGLAPGLAGTFELTANALRFHVVPEVVGVCCRGATCDASIDQVSCVGAGTAGASFSIASGTCNSGLSTSTPCCYADFNKVNGISVQDIFDFLNAWFSGSLYAIPGGDGASGTLAVQNIFDFLNAWFAGGC